MLDITVNKTSLRTIRQGDPKWMLRDGFIMAPRAGFEIDKNCPKEYKNIIAQCIDRGWLKPIANLKDHELFWENLSE